MTIITTSKVWSNQSNMKLRNDLFIATFAIGLASTARITISTCWVDTLGSNFRARSVSTLRAIRDGSKFTTKRVTVTENMKSPVHSATKNLLTRNIAERTSDVVHKIPRGTKRPTRSVTTAAERFPTKECQNTSNEFTLALLMTPKCLARFVMCSFEKVTWKLILKGNDLEGYTV